MLGCCVDNKAVEDNDSVAPLTNSNRGPRSIEEDAEENAVASTELEDNDSAIFKTARFLPHETEDSLPKEDEVFDAVSGEDLEPLDCQFCLEIIDEEDRKKANCFNKDCYSTFCNKCVDDWHRKGNGNCPNPYCEISWPNALTDAFEATKIEKEEAERMQRERESNEEQRRAENLLSEQFIAHIDNGLEMSDQERQDQIDLYNGFARV
jgi:hypothetical protein